MSIRTQKIRTLDTKDQKILAELERNARFTNKQIGKKTGLNPDVVRYRINRLQEDGIITSFMTFVNFAKIGYTDFGVYVSTQHMTREKEQEFISYIQQFPYTTYFEKIGGQYDFIVALLAKDIYHFNEIQKQINEKFGWYIAKTAIAIRVALFHFPRQIATNLENQQLALPFFGGEIEDIKLDLLDQTILKQLQSNARIPIIELAKKIGKPASTVTSRIKKLEEQKIIDNYYVFLNPHAFGYDNYHASLYTKNMTEEDENALYTYCMQHPSITVLIKCIGPWQYELAVEVPDQEKLQEISNELKEQFSENILQIDLTSMFVNYKYDLYPFEIDHN